VVANAGNIRPCLLYEASQEDWDRTFSIHANGSFYCYRHAAPILMKQGGGTIITTGAAAGEGLPGRIGMDMPAYPKLGAYRAAKAAILVLTLNAASEMLPYNINVNTIMPGAISTRMVDTFYSSIADRGLSNEGIPAGFVDPSPPEAVPPLGVFLSTDAGRHITGRVFSNVYKNELRVARAPAVNDTLSTRDAIWSVDELSEVLPRWLANDGFPSPDGTSA
jgi:3-oxoacyl-[acyl-carrier protein] reductase